MSMRINRRIHIFIKRRLPPHLRRTRNIFFVSFTVCALVGLLCIAPWLYWMGNTSSAHSALIASGFVALSMCIWRYGGGVKWGGLLYQTTLMGLVLYNAAITGGVTSPVLTWLAIIPLLPLFTASRAWALASMATSLLSVISLYWLQSRGMLPINESQFALQSATSAALPTETPWQNMSFAAGMFSLMLFAQMMLVQTYDTANEQHLRRLRQSNKRLESLSTHLKAANAHKDQFLAMVSHEMRTPLNAVMGYLGLLSTDTQLPQIAGQYVQGARNSAAHLVTVINDLLDFSQIQQGKLVLTPQAVNLRDMLTNTHQTLAPRASEQGIAYPLELDASLPMWASIDPHRLAQIIINLLGNALKFTSKGQVAMRVAYTPDSALAKHGQLAISVTDTGAGIAAESLEAIFKPFVQLKISDNDLKAGNALHGNGLGLAITRSLIQSHKGSIAVSSEVGIGSTFTVTLPIEEVAQPTNHLAVDTVTYTATLDLLVVDDHLTNRLVASATIKRSLPNATIDQAMNGTEALEKMREHRYDLVLMDLIMPDISGTEVVRRIRGDANSSYAEVPVIALTANVAEEAVNECMSLGFKDVLPKPFDKEVLIQAILTHALKDEAQPTAL
jgi:signal transduction histidine kinase/ActR/RegA family two-component response regulator